LDPDPFFEVDFGVFLTLLLALLVGVGELLVALGEETVLGNKLE